MKTNKTMSRKTIILALLAVLSLTAQNAAGQELKMNAPSLSDYLPLLNAKGYKAYSFSGTKKLKGTEVEPAIMEYIKGEEPKEVLDFSISMSFEGKLVIGFYPSENDSTANFLFHFGKKRVFGGRLGLKPISAPEKPESKQYFYGARPFELSTSFEKGKFIPLVLYGSYWYDPEVEGCRFCGEDEIKPDLSSDILEYVPHYYILGIKIN